MYLNSKLKRLVTFFYEKKYYIWLNEIDINMDLKSILSDKLLGGKEKTEIISKALLDKKFSTDELIEVARFSKDKDKGTCIEALEFATKINSSIADLSVLDFVTSTLADKAPRVKWESAKVIANIANLFPNQLEEAVKNLLENTEFSGTVVRWSAALALGEILKLKTPLNQDLVPALESICESEEKNSIKKIYQAAFKKINK